MRTTHHSKNTNGLSNDAIVCVCLKSMADSMTWQEFRERAKERGYVLTISQCHNMLSRAIGYVNKASNGTWVLTAQGSVFKEEVLKECTYVCAAETREPSIIIPTLPGYTYKLYKKSGDGLAEIPGMENDDV